MKRNYRNWLISGMFILAMSSLPDTMLAQLPPPDDCLPTDPAHQPDTPPCPVDGGIGFLVAAGVVYGAKKVKENRNKKAVQLT